MSDITLPSHNVPNGPIMIHSAKAPGTLDANIIIANAPDPVFVSDLEGKILQANDAVSQLLGFLARHARLRARGA